MVAAIIESLNNLASIIPGYDDTAGYELSGFLWFHGWNDMIDRKKVDEYENNLANLIRDLRTDLQAPKMPFIVGGMGQRGLQTTGRYAVNYF